MDAEQGPVGPTPEAPEPPADGMTIEELARRARCTTRNIRNFQTLGLVPYPTMVGRVGHYDEGHLGRLRLVMQLQERGFSLAGIAKLLQAWETGHTLADVLGFEEALTAPWIDEEPVLMRAEELLEMFPEAAADPTLVARSFEIGLLAVEGDLVKVISPKLLKVGTELVRAGVPLQATLDELVELRLDLKRVARRFVDMFDRFVWMPYAAAGMPSDQLPAVTEALQRMRPLAAATVEVVLAQAMQRQTAENTAAWAVPGSQPEPSKAVIPEGETREPETSKQMGEQR